MLEKTFNLLYEPWILVLNLNGETEEVSLLTALERAHEFRSLAGELPTQDVAILRLLLATLYATFTRVDIQGNKKNIENASEALERWQSLWELKRFPVEPIKTRLCYYEERFFLFHPERPFYQVAGLHEAKGKRNTVAQIISDVPSRAERRFISTKSGQNAEVLSFAEATRWLVSMQAWDYAGKKASVVNGSPNGGGTGWLGKIGVVYPALNTLFETLMLNFVLLKSDGNLLPYGSPTWEENQLPTPKKIERRPAGYCELLTWQSRRVRLFTGEGNNSSLVTGVLYSYGDVFQTSDMFFEQMTGWHLSTMSDTKGHFIPNKHQKERSLWRELSSILPQAINNIDEDNYNPGVIQWLALLQEKILIPHNIIQLQSVGFHYGAMDAKVESMMADTLSIHTGIFTKLGANWVLRISNILQLTDNCVQQLFFLAADLAKASGDSDSLHHRAGEGISSIAKAEAYFRLDMPFRKWLANIDPTQTDIDEAEDDWKNIVKQVLLQLGEEMTEQTGENGIVGRWVKSKNDTKGKLYTAPGALIKFRSNIKRTIEKGG
ncbi:MAG: type I-E CRISPR-associated protein Cse1/CasA [Desulfitobacteriaceae bacterium]|nr:type I-E CRISPR-associated protein Cse1/CasA [Desulfitobacteriaceae bacterium]